MKENERKCYKCGCSPAQDPNISLHRFPKPGRTNSLRCELWAKYCFPHDSWSSPEFQNKLHSRHLMLCTKHFKRSSFIDNSGKRLVKSAAPDEECIQPKNDLMNYYQHKLMNEEPRLKPTASLCFNAPNKSEDSTELTKLLLHHATTRKPVKRKYEDTVMPSTSSYSTIPVKEIKTIDVALQTSKSFLLKPIENLQLQDTPGETQELPSCSSTTVENTDICDANDDADDDSDTLVKSNVENTDICDDEDNADDDSDTLVDSNVCRVCLAMDVKMYELNNIELREMFQNITGIAVTENNHPILEGLCWECAGRLKAAAAFRNKALLSDALLQGLANTGEQIRKNDITLIKDSEDYLKTAATLTAVEAFHTVDIDPEDDGIPPLSENNDTKIVQNTLREDFLTQNNENIIEEDNDQRVVEDESMIEAPINTEMEYDQFDHNICPNTGEESSNVFLETNPLFSSNILLKEDTINSKNSSPPPICSQVQLKYPVLGYLLKTPSDCEDKVKKDVIKITKKNSISRIVSRNSIQLISAKSKYINVKIGGISKKTSNLKLVKSTQVKANTPTDEESLRLADVEF